MSDKIYNMYCSMSNNSTVLNDIRYKLTAFTNPCDVSLTPAGLR